MAISLTKIDLKTIFFIAEFKPFCLSKFFWKGECECELVERI